MKKTAKLTIESERIIVIRRRGSRLQAMCEACGEVVRLATADEAAALACTTAREIYRLVEARKLHFIETAEGSLLICFNSLCDSPLGTGARSLMNDSDWKGEIHENLK